MQNTSSTPQPHGNNGNANWAQTSLYPSSSTQAPGQGQPPQQQQQQQHPRQPSNPRAYSTDPMAGIESRRDVSHGHHQQQQQQQSQQQHQSQQQLPPVQHMQQQQQQLYPSSNDNYATYQQNPYTGTASYTGYGGTMNMYNTTSSSPSAPSGSRRTSNPISKAGATPPAGGPLPPSQSRYYPDPSSTSSNNPAATAPTPGSGSGPSGEASGHIAQSPYQPSSAPPQVSTHQHSMNQPQTAHPYGNGGGYYNYYDQSQGQYYPPHHPQQQPQHSHHQSMPQVQAQGQSHVQPHQYQHASSSRSTSHAPNQGQNQNQNHSQSMTTPTLSQGPIESSTHSHTPHAPPHQHPHSQASAPGHAHARSTSSPYEYQAPTHSASSSSYPSGYPTSPWQPPATARSGLPPHSMPQNSNHSHVHGQNQGHAQWPGGYPSVPHNYPAQSYPVQQQWTAPGSGNHGGYYPTHTPHTQPPLPSSVVPHILPAGSKKVKKEKVAKEEYPGLGKRAPDHTDEDEDHKKEKRGRKKKIVVEEKEKEEKPVPKPPAKSHLHPPRQAQSAWQLFFTDELNKAKASAAAHGDSPGGTPHQAKLNVAQIAKDAGAAYGTLNDEQKAYYATKVQESKDQYARELAEWQATLTPEDIRAENAFRAQQRKEGKSRKGNLKDPNAPKKPLSAYFLFLKGIREDDALRARVWGEETETTKQSVLAAERWRALSDDEKKPFLQQAEKDKQDYETSRKAYEEEAAARARGEIVPLRLVHPEPSTHVPPMPASALVEEYKPRVFDVSPKKRAAGIVDGLLSPETMQGGQGMMLPKLEQSIESPNHQTNSNVDFKPTEMTTSLSTSPNGGQDAAAALPLQPTSAPAHQGTSPPAMNHFDQSIDMDDEFQGFADSDPLEGIEYMGLDMGLGDVGMEMDFGFAVPVSATEEKSGAEMPMPIEEAKLQEESATTQIDAGERSNEMPAEGVIADQESSVPSDAAASNANTAQPESAIIDQPVSLSAPEPATDVPSGDINEPIVDIAPTLAEANLQDPELAMAICPPANIAPEADSAKAEAEVMERTREIAGSAEGHFAIPDLSNTPAPESGLATSSEAGAAEGSGEPTEEVNELPDAGIPPVMDELPMSVAGQVEAEAGAAIATQFQGGAAPGGGSEAQAADIDITENSTEPEPHQSHVQEEGADLYSSNPELEVAISSEATYGAAPLESPFTTAPVEQDVGLDGTEIGKKTVGPATAATLDEKLDEAAQVEVANQEQEQDSLSAVAGDMSISTSVSEEEGGGGLFTPESEVVPEADQGGEMPAVDGV